MPRSFKAHSLNEVEIWFGLIPITVSALAKSNLSADIFALCRTVKN